MKRISIVAVIVMIGLLGITSAWAQVPQIINYQGQVAVGNARFDGTGQFKFALVDSAGNTTYWSHNGTSTAGAEPTGNGIALPVTKGQFSVGLGDTAIAGMTQPISPPVFLNNGLYLRVWFRDGQHPFEQLKPDLRVASVGYAMTAANAATVPDGSITGAKLAAGAITAAKLADGAVTDAKIAGGISVGKISGLPDLQANLAQLTQAYSNFTALLTRLNTPPVAEAGADQYSLFGSTIGLDGSSSWDPNGNPLTFRWSLSSVPAGSTVILSDSTTVRPSFLPDVPGSYTAQLVVNDGLVDSPPDTVTVRIHEGQFSVLATGVNAIPQVAVDGQGNAMAGWAVPSSSSYGAATFMVSRYFAGSTWGAATAAAEMAYFYRAKLVMGTDGTAWLVWNSLSPDSLHAKKFTPQSGWGPTEDVYLAATGEYNVEPAVAMNDQGNVVVAWWHSSRDANGVYQFSIWANTRTSSGWGQPSALSDPIHYSLVHPHAALDEQNQAMVVWVQTPESGALPAIWWNRFNVGSTPGPANPVATARPGARGTEVYLGANRQGIAQVAWVEYRECPTNSNILLSSLLTKRFTPGAGWDTTQVLFEGDESLSVDQFADVAVDNYGNAIASWVLNQPEDPSSPPNPNPPVSRLLASYYGAGSGWGDPVRLSGPQDFAGNSRVKFDAQGNAKIVWNEWRYSPETLETVRVKEYTQSAGWNAPLHMIAQDPYVTFDDMAVSANGTTVVVGRRNYGQDIWANVMAQP